MYQLNTKRTKWLYNIQSVDKIFQMAIKYVNNFPPQFTQIGIFGSKINHLATLYQGDQMS
jgi:hypothetical protein